MSDYTWSHEPQGLIKWDTCIHDTPLNKPCAYCFMDGELQEHLSVHWLAAKMAQPTIARYPVGIYEPDNIKLCPESAARFEVVRHAPGCVFHLDQYHWECTCGVLSQAPRPGYGCDHKSLNDKNGKCPDCVDVIWWHHLGQTRDGGYIGGNPYGSIDTNPPKPPKEYTASQVEHGKNIARAIG